MSGFTKSYRAKWTNPVFRNLNEAGIWSWMCDTAVWKETKVRFNGQLITLQRGQLVTSIRFISEGFGVGEQVTRTFLENLKNDSMVNVQSNNRGMTITICNYANYQDSEEQDNTPGNTDTTSIQRAANTNKKELKNIRTKESKNKKETGSRFALTDLPPEWKSFCLEKRPDLEPHELFEEFADYWKGVPGQRGRKLDWFGTWRNRVRDKRRDYKKPTSETAEQRIARISKEMENESIQH